MSNCDKNKNISIIRGQDEWFRFKRHDTDGGEITVDPSEMYFSIKTNYKSTSYILQKKLSEEEIYYEEGWWYVEINAEDTANLPYGNYYFDIKVIEPQYVRYIVKSTPIAIEPNVTAEVT